MEAGMGRSRGRGKPSEVAVPSKPLRRPKTIDDADEDQFYDVQGEGNQKVLAGASLKIIQDMADRTRHMGLDPSALPRPERISSPPVTSQWPRAGPETSNDSKLNVHATPFFPRTERQRSSYSDSSDRCRSRDGVATPGLELFSSEDDYHPLVNYLTEVLTCVTIYPGRFERQATKLVNVLNKRVIPDADVLGTIVETIYSQSVIEANFRYNGARLCNALCERLEAKFDKVTFRSLLLQRLQTDHKRREELANLEPETLRGFALFLCEIYLNLEIRAGSGASHRLIPLQKAIMETLNTLVSHPSSENLICACKCLKLAGTALEDDERLHHGGASPQMSVLMDLVKHTSMDATDVSKDAKMMMLNVIELRSSDWGRSVSSPGIQSHRTFTDYRTRTPSFGSSSYQGNGHVQYGADFADPFSAEGDCFAEAADQFDEEDIDFSWSSGEDEEHDGGMDKEMQRAYEEFMKGV